ncbi:hypothetical protein D3C87_932440 [compost metagenome]
MAAGAVVVWSVDAGDAIEHIPRLSGALAFELFAADHIAPARVLEHIDLRSVAEPVADDFRGVQLQRGIRHRLQAERIVAFGARLQTGAFKQCIQTLLRCVTAFQATALHTAGDLRTKRNQHARFTAKLVEGVLQRRRRDVISLGINGQRGGQGTETQAGAEDKIAQGTSQWREAGGVHVG